MSIRAHLAELCPSRQGRQWMVFVLSWACAGCVGVRGKGMGNGGNEGLGFVLCTERGT